MKSHSDKIAALLEKGRTITHRQALDMFDCSRLSARIKNLRHRGMTIETIPFKTKSGKTIGKYKLIQSA